MSDAIRPRPWTRPSFPIAVGLAIAPTAATLQSKAMAPLALVVLLLTVLAYWRLERRLPVPRAAATGIGLALGGWAVVSALWALDPGRAVWMGLSVAGIALLAAAGALAVARDTAEARRLLAWCLGIGLAVGLAVALVDDATGNAIRAGVRGLKEIPPQLAFGLKPAGSVMALLLPMLALLPVGWRWRVPALLAGAVALLLLPGDSAKLAALLGVALVVATTLLGRHVATALGLACGLAVLLVPLVLPAALPHLRAGGLPPSAAHRMMIWDFAETRIGDRPVLGWGMEAARDLPGAQDGFAAADLDRLRILDPALRQWLTQPGIQRLPLHPHNGALQLRLELGLPGSLLGAAFLMALGWLASRSRAPAVAAGVLGSGFVTLMLSFGLWQAWWLCSLALAAAACAAGRVEK